MNSKQIIMKSLIEIMNIFPEYFDKITFLDRVTEKTLEESVARYLVTYSPIYLPLFERDGDLFSLHIKANGNLYESPILKLFHDVEYPLYLSTSIKTFPYAILDSIIDMKKNYDEIIPSLKFIFDKYKLPIPERSYFDKYKDEYYQIIYDFDKSNRILQIRKKTALLMEEDAYLVLQQMYEDDPNDLFFVCLMLVQTRLNIDFDKGRLFSFINNEYSYTYSKVQWYRKVKSSIGLFEAIKQNCLSLITPDNPFYLVKDIPLTDPKSIDKLLEIASIFSKQGDDLTALNQVRNACTIAGAYGNGLTKDLCKTLAEYTKKVEPDGLAYHLANFAVDVIDLGP